MAKATMKTSEQVLTDFLQYVGDYRLKEGDRLPPERELAVTLGTSRPTLRKILDRFGKAGLLERQRKGGTVLLAALDAGQIASPPQASVVSFIAPGDPELDLRRVETLLQNLLLSRNCLLNTYHSSPDKQDAGKERQYLRSLFRINPKGIIATASPYGHTNDDLFAELDAAGIRVVHIHYYRDELPAEAFAIPDWRCAGVMAAAHLQASGCRRLVYSHPSGDHPGTRLTYAGLQKGATLLGLDLLPSRALGNQVDVDARSVARFIAGLPESTGIVTQQSLAGAYFAEELSRQRGGVAADMPVIALGDEYPDAVQPILVPTLCFSQQARIRLAVDYLTAPGNHSPPPRILTTPVLYRPAAVT